MYLIRSKYLHTYITSLSYSPQICISPRPSRVFTLQLLAKISGLQRIQQVIGKALQRWEKARNLQLLPPAQRLRTTNSPIKSAT